MLDGPALGGAPLVYTAVWCVYVLDMGVCASSGSVGFWTIIPTALRSQLRSHAHFWHSFPDMITIHLPLWVWLHGIFPSLPSGTGTMFQKWTAHPCHPLTLSSLSHPPTPPLCLLLIPPTSNIDSCCLAERILRYGPFPLWVSCLCLLAWLGHLAATSLHWPPARMGKEGGGAESRIEERRSSHGTVSPLPVSLPIFCLNPHAVSSYQNL